jgi:hypothetical protein
VNLRRRGVEQVDVGDDQSTIEQVRIQFAKLPGDVGIHVQ